MAESGSVPLNSEAARGRYGRLPLAAALACLAFGCLHLVVVFVRAPALPEDDAFITMRYAANLAAGKGFVYNAGQRVLGTTSPLFALLLAPVARFAGPAALPHAALGLNCLLMLTTAFVVVSLLQATTQINEQTLSFLPKLVAMMLGLLFFGPWMLSNLVDFTRSLLVHLPVWR